MRLGSFSVLLFLLFLSCSSNEENDRVGNVLFVVESPSGNPIDSEIGTIPETKISIIDENGQARLNGIPQGVYEFYASHPTLGYGSLTRTVFEDKTVEINISLKDEMSMHPQIVLIQPSKFASFIFGNPIKFKANLYDDKDAPPDLKIKLSSDIDGVLFDGVGPSVGLFEYLNSTLKIGDHNMSFSVMDTDGFETTIDFSIEITIDHTQLEIDSIAANQEGVYLSWTKELSPGLQYYEVLRGYTVNNLIEIEQFTDSETISFFDNSLDVNREVFYKVKYVFANATFETEVKSIFYQGRSLVVGHGSVNIMVADPIRKFVYAIERNLWKLHFVNAENLTVEKTMLFNQPRGLTINKANDRLYVLTSVEDLIGKIEVIDLNTQEVIREIELTNFGAFFSPDYIEWVEGDKIVMVEGWRVHMLDLATEENVYGSVQFISPEMVTNNSKDKVFVIQYIDNSLDIDITQFEVSSNNLVVENQFVDPEGLKVMPVLSGDDNNLFVGNKKYSVGNLSNSSIVTEDEIVLASNYSGSRVAYRGGIYDTEQSLPVKLFNYNSEEVITYDNKEFVAYNSADNLMVFYKIDE